MRKLIYISLVSIIAVCSCKKREVINTQSLDESIKIVDSLHNAIAENYKFTITGIYEIIDDTILADSISKMVILPDTLLFYKLLQRNILELDELYYQVQQEIYFAKDQLKGLKEDATENMISKAQFEIQIESNDEMIKVLKQLIDSNMSVINSISEVLFLHSADTIP